MRAGRVLQVAVLAVLLGAGATTAAPMTTVTVAQTADIVHAPKFVGVARHIFEKYGLNVQIRTVPTGFDALDQVAAGSAEVAYAAASPIGQTLGRGARLKSIAAAWGDATGRVATDEIFAVIARKSSGIREGHLEDLRGRKVGLPRGTDIHMYLFYALVAKGLDPQSATTIVSIPGPGLPGALQSGAVDATVSVEPIASRILQSTGDAIVVQRGGNHVQFLGFQVVSQAYLATHPGTITRYLTAFAEAAQYTRAHQDEAVDIMAQQIPGLGRDAVRAALRFVDLDPRVSKATVRAAQDGYDFAIKIGALSRAPSFGEMFDLRSLRQVEREHPEFFADLPPIPSGQQL